MSRRLLLALLPVSLACTAPPGPPPGWNSRELNDLAFFADDLELRMLDPNAHDHLVPLAQYPVLGRAAIALSDRWRLVRSLDAALRPEDPMSFCFLPRHALVGTTPKGPIEVIICYECKTIAVDGDLMPIEGGDAVIEELRIAAGLPIAD